MRYCFSHIKEYWQTRIDMQDHADIPSYLAARLKCDVSQVELMMNNFPGVKKVSVSKLKRTLDYLLIGAQHHLACSHIRFQCS